METDMLKAKIEAGLTACTANVAGDGRHFEATVISSDFIGKSTVNRQQLVYSVLGDAFSSGHIHALSLKTYSPEQWADLQKE